MARPAEPDGEAERRTGDDRRLDEEAFDRAYGYGLADEAIETECGAEHEAEPREHARGNRLNRDAQGGDRNRQDLSRFETLAQEEIAGDDVEKRIDVIAERRLGGAAGLDRPNIEAPVENDEEAREGKGQEDARIGENAQAVAKASECHEQRRGDRQGPQAAMDGDLGCRDMADEPEIEGHAAPDEMSEHAIKRALFGFAQTLANKRLLGTDHDRRGLAGGAAAYKRRLNMERMRQAHGPRVPSPRVPPKPCALSARLLSK